jgi:hypothetical protein
MLRKRSILFLRFFVPAAAGLRMTCGFVLCGRLSSIEVFSNVVALTVRKTRKRQALRQISKKDGCGQEDQQPASSRKLSFLTAFLSHYFYFSFILPLFHFPGIFLKKGLGLGPICGFCIHVKGSLLSIRCDQDPGIISYYPHSIH